MTIHVGIIGMGFMGNMHLNTYAAIEGVKVVAVCDIETEKLETLGQTGGNIEGDGTPLDTKDITLYSTAKALIADPNVDVVDITLPTDLHCAYTLKVFKGGKHVICEKPMARSVAEGRKMLAAAKKAKRSLFVGHCIRYWPAYAKAREIVKSKVYGKVVSACFTRVSPTPTWSHKNWLLEQKRSGGAMLDLHIHDTDFILHTFGKPRAVTSHTGGAKKGRQDHVVTTYSYPGQAAVVAEGGWDFAPGFPFSMTFRIAMKNATLVFDENGFMLHPQAGDSTEIEVAPEDGYHLELCDFIDCLANNRASTVVTPKTALKSLIIAEAQNKSAKSGKSVAVKF